MLYASRKEGRKEGWNCALQVLMHLCHFFGHLSPKHHQFVERPRVSWSIACNRLCYSQWTIEKVNACRRNFFHTVQCRWKVKFWIARALIWKFKVNNNNNNNNENNNNLFNQGKPVSWSCYKCVLWATKKLTIKGKNNYNRSAIRKMDKLCTMSMDKN